MSTLQEFLIKSAGMEKKALNLASLLRMSRNAAQKGKLRRFSDLLDKRNLAINNVARARSSAAMNQRPMAYIEADLLGHYRGPEMKAYQRLADRHVARRGNPYYTNEVINLRRNTKDDPFDMLDVRSDLFGNTAGPWNLDQLADYSVLQSKTNPIDKLTYPGL